MGSANRFITPATTFEFTGTVKQVVYDLSGDAIDDAEAETRHAMSKQ